MTKKEMTTRIVISVAGIIAGAYAVKYLKKANWL